MAVGDESISRRDSLVSNNEFVVKEGPHVGSELEVSVSHTNISQEVTLVSHKDSVGKDVEQVDFVAIPEDNVAADMNSDFEVSCGCENISQQGTSSSATNTGSDTLMVRVSFFLKSLFVLFLQNLFV